MLTDAEMTALQGTRVAGMMDVCTIIKRVRVPDDYGELEDSWEEQPETICGFRFTGGERASLQGLPEGTDATVVLPIGTLVEGRDRIRPVSLRGSEVADPDVYSIIGPIQIGVTGLMIPLRKVTA